MTMLGLKHSPETIAKISKTLRGQKPWNAGIKTGPRSPEAITASAAGHLGLKRSTEARAHMSAAARAAYEANPDLRASKIGNTRVRDATIKGECVYCGGPATEHDHIIPRGRPGWDDPSNIVLACRPCNAAKSSRTPEEWLLAMTTLTPVL